MGGLLFLALSASGFVKLMGQLDSVADYVKAFGSFGLGGAMLWFVRSIMFDHRVSQVSLALFESHVAEVKAALDEIPPGCDNDQRRALRAEAWRSFRVGLNDLWIAERKTTDGKELEQNVPS